MSWLSNPTYRQWIYNVLIAAGPLLVAYGILAESTAALWANLVAAILMVTGGGVARAHVSDGGEHGN